MLCFPVRTGAKSVCTNIWRSKVGADGINGGGLSVFSISPSICLIKMAYSSSSSPPLPSLGFGPDPSLQLDGSHGLMSFLFKSAQKTLLFALMTLSLYMLLRTSLLGLKSVRPGELLKLEKRREKMKKGGEKATTATEEKYRFKTVIKLSR